MVYRLEDERYELFGEELEEGEYYETESSSENEREDSKVEEKSTAESEEIVEPKRKVKRSVSFVEPEGVNEAKVEGSVKEKEASIEDAECSEEDIQRIEFSHSDANPVVESGDSIRTPADIYRIFSKPKSILKRSPNDIPAGHTALPDYEMEEEEEEEEETIKPSAYETVRN